MDTPLGSCAMPYPATVLVVDDAPIQTRLLEQMLSKHYRVALAGSGEEGLAMAREQLPDLILLDILMPGMDGFAVFRALQADERTRGIPVVFLTARDTEMDQALGLEAGGVDYITKPCPARVLQARVRTQIELKHSRDRLAESEARYRALFLHIPQPVAVWRMRGDRFCLEEHNLAAARLCTRLTGASGEKPAEGHPELPELEEHLANCLRNGKDITLDITLADPEGKPVRLTANLTCIPPDSVLMLCEA
jgi:CheY-like chemotaxis protein